MKDVHLINDLYYDDVVSRNDDAAILKLYTTRKWTMKANFRLVILILWDFLHSMMRANLMGIQWLNIPGLPSIYFCFVTFKYIISIK